MILGLYKFVPVMKNRIIGFRIDQETEELLKRICAHEDRTVPDVLRRMIIEKAKELEEKIYK